MSDYDQHWTEVLRGLGNHPYWRNTWTATCKTCRWVAPQPRTSEAAAQLDADEHVVALAR